MYKDFSKEVLIFVYMFALF